MDDEDRNFKHSPLSGTFSREGEGVNVEIHRYVGTQDLWQLIVIGLPTAGASVWHEAFATGQEADDALTAMVKADGMASLVGRPPRSLN